LLVFGVYLAIRAPLPSIAALAALTAAALVSGFLLGKALWHYEPWTVGAPSVLRAIAPLAAWSTAGASVHWLFSQGYAYLAANVLDITAVAAIAATRLMMMPVNLLSTGIGALMLPLTVGWLQQHGPAVVLRRLGLFALALSGVAVCYFALLWVLRDFIFAEVLRKQFAQRDQLLLLWSGAFFLMTARDQLIYLLVARERFRQLTLIAFVSATISLAASYFAMRRYGVIGAPLGVLVGEIINLTGIVLLSLRQTSAVTRAAACAGAAS
ncbi:MAG: capsular biosynthesis protein, partial [Candidatus Obscuribacterales bacterium]|nr:capsular biosynthesis protein [Steroidobacteraceae bacterium]